ncbi:hypothetical protein [Pelagibacterium limicola]|uniref:hypothetical protein n=1 Tax=Pelagibacterium limicola TaxID=2791022 RepID=UPI0018AFB4D5|nr:hypothetical protein [Pelagibacterium limicola]
MKQAKETMDVERLVTWAMVEQGLGWAMSGGGSGARTGYAALGTRIDGGTIGPPSISLLSDDDAVIVRDAIVALDERVGELVLRHGRTGTRPDWCEEGPGYWRQKTGANGHPAWHYAKPGDRRSQRTAVMEFIGWPEKDVVRWRKDYTDWWDGLAGLVDIVNGRMASHEATGPRVSRTPWEEEKRAILTPDGPFERHRKAEDRVSAEYVEIAGRKIRRDQVRTRA